MNHSHIFMRFPEGRAKALTFSFDDGSDQDRFLVDLFRDCGLKGTFNLNAGLMPPTDDFDFDSLDPDIFPCRKYQHRLCPESVRKLYGGSGMEVATHGYIHAILPYLDDDALLYEIMRDRQKLEEIMGVPVRGHAYSQGAYDDRTVGLLQKAGIVYARTTVSTHTCALPQDFMRWPLTCGWRDPALENISNNFLAFRPTAELYFDRVKSQLLYLFAHSFEFVTGNGFAEMEALAHKLAGKEDVWYCTNMEYYRYAQAYRALDFNLDRTVVYNPSAQPVWIFANKKDHMIAPGEMKEIG